MEQAVQAILAEQLAVAADRGQRVRRVPRRGGSGACGARGDGLDAGEPRATAGRCGWRRWKTGGC